MITDMSFFNNETSINVFHLPKSSSIWLIMASSSSSLWSILFVSSLTIITAEYHFCTSKKNYTASSSFPSNLNVTLSSLSTNATRSSKQNGFYNTSSGQGPDRANALFLCRGDVSPEICQNCVKARSNDIRRRCPNQKEAIIWYDECMLRYSNESIFSVMVQKPAVHIWSETMATDYIQFSGGMGVLLNRLIDQAASSANLFATGDWNGTGEVNGTRLYGLVQCTPDITPSDCKTCLANTFGRIPTCCDSGSISVGAKFYKPSCNIEYQVYPFYNETMTVAPAPAPMSPPRQRKFSLRTLVPAIVAPIAVSTVLFIIGCCFLSRRARKKDNVVLKENGGNDITIEEALQFDFATIEEATDRFSTDNKLGEGGFGVVYKGICPNGQEIAVKRLSRTSSQGAEEFKNEVVLVAKLQHRNLVRLLGFCLERDEKILVYEFVHNKSLDYFLFDPEKQRLLDWSRRYKLIVGIARGILYLHEDSRLRIIHRDLKASNILLDKDMNPKISDFGLARIFGVDQTQGNTRRIVGTCGYMSPEYAMHGHFSVKSDVYSFGVLILEIVTGKRNSSFYQTDGAENLMSYAWKHWRDETPLQLLDSNLKDSYSRNEVIRCIHLGLLCVQEDPSERPTMETIALMLESYSVTLSWPQEPAFFLSSRKQSDMTGTEMGSEKSTSKSIPWSVDEASITEIYPR